MSKISTFLWFDTQAEEAMNLYTSIFRNSKRGTIARYGAAGPGPEGSVMTASFELEGQEFVALNGGPLYKFNESISLVVNCDSQEEVDEYWEKLTAGGGKPIECGWLKDKFGLCWQITPRQLGQMLSDKDPQKSKRTMEAMLTMQKLDIAALRKAYEGR